MPTVLPIGIISILVALATSSATGRELPEGWRLPTQKELVDVEREDSPSKYARAVADFNGDGVDDEALLLKSTKFSGEALWVYLSNGANDGAWIKLNEINWGTKYLDVNLGMGIDVAAPGVHAYGGFCGTGGPDSEGPRPKLKLRDPSLVYFKPGSAASLYFWSRKSMKFLCVWISD